MIRYFLILILLFISSCSVSKVHNSSEVVGVFWLESGSYIKFEKTLRTYRNWLEGVSGDRYDTLLWYCNESDDCQMVDKQAKQTPEYTSVLYQGESLYSPLNSDEKYQQVNQVHYGYYHGAPGFEEYKFRDKSWDVFVSPTDFNLSQYKEIKTTIENNLKEMNQLLSVSISGGIEGKSTYNATPFLNSITYREYTHDDILKSKQDAAIYFNCTDKEHALVLYPPNQIRLSLPLEDRPVEMADALVGYIDEERKSAKLRAPYPYIQQRFKVTGNDLWFQLYKKCRDNKGKSIFDYYNTIKWGYEYKY